MANLLKLDAQQLLTKLQQFPEFSSIKTWWLAYSGGVDSRVLLHLLSQLHLPLRAVYVDHGLQAASKQWAEHCKQTCTRLNIPLTVIEVNAHAERGESPEAAARRARYHALSTVVAANDCVLTAQHADDQAETFLLQLLRGAGAAGLSAMPFAQVFHQGWLLRPLLEYSRQNILHIAQAENLHWVEDPSNNDVRFDRNYLRQKVLPLLAERWPQSVRTIAKAAQQQAENQALLEELAAQDLQLDTASSTLSVDTLINLAVTRQRNALRYWLEQNNVRMPSRAIMQQIVTQMIHRREDAEACVRWDDVELFCYRKQLYLQKSMAHDAEQVLILDAKKPLYIASLQQQLFLEAVKTGGLTPEIFANKLVIKFRQGGEKIKPAGHAHTRTLKNLFQQNGVPPWLRDRIPLLYLNNELIAVCGYWIAETYAVKSGEGWLPVIEEKENANAPL